MCLRLVERDVVVCETYQWPFPDREVVISCYHPVTAYYAREVNPSGKRSLVFKREFAYTGGDVRLSAELKLPCGGCVGCRLERARQWAVRCMHEKRMSQSSAFVTLTYDDDYLPVGGTLVKRDMQLFMKRLRRGYGDGIRFFGCGEYGDLGGRPHYHLLLFNVGFADRRSFGKSKRGEQLFVSAGLSRVWRFGHHSIGDVTFESCQYVARYICDKITGERAEDHYRRIDRFGECFDLAPEFVLMSRRPGIGLAWYDKYGDESFEHDNCIVGGKPTRIPRFYDKKLEASDPARMAAIKRERTLQSMQPHVKAEQSPDRRKVREEVTRQNLKRFRRDVT